MRVRERGAAREREAKRASGQEKEGQEQAVRGELHRRGIKSNRGKSKRSCKGAMH